MLTYYCDGDATTIAAYVRLGRAGRVLDLCKHHYERHELALLAAGWTVLVDRRADLDPAPAPAMAAP